MKVVSFCLFVLFFALGCSKDEEIGFTSLIGSWTYTTPDEKIKVTFDIIGGTTEILSIQNQLIVVDGVEGKAEVQAEDVTETTLGRIRINANDAGLTFPYNITFNKLSGSSDFSVIDVEDATYTFPWPDSNSLNSIQIVRR